MDRDTPVKKQDTGPDRIVNVGGFNIYHAQSLTDHFKDKPLPPYIINGLFREGDVSILFSKSGLGKTTLAKQWMNMIATGENIGGFELGDIRPKNCLFLDYETNPQSAVHLLKAETGDGFAELKGVQLIATPEVAAYKNKQGQVNIHQSIEDAVLKAGEAIGKKIDVLFIDNLSNICPTLEKGESATVITEGFMGLRNELGITIVILAHTPKIPANVPTDIGHLAGSAQVVNKVDNVFSIAKNYNQSILAEIYLTHLKSRYMEKLYDEKHSVPLFRQKMADGFPFLASRFDQTLPIGAFITKQEDLDRKERDDQIERMALLGAAPSLIADMYEMSKRNVTKILEKRKVIYVEGSQRWVKKP